MKLKMLVLSLAVLLGARGGLWAQTYSIDWFKIGGGGGVSTGGVYSVAGTIGQAEAGAMSGGPYSIQGGFWSILAAIPTPGAPKMRIFLTSTNTAVVAWPASAVNFKLQQANDLQIGSWIFASQTPTVVGSEEQVVLPVPSGSRFFRLQHQ